CGKCNFRANFSGPEFRWPPDVREYGAGKNQALAFTRAEIHLPSRGTNFSRTEARSDESRSRRRGSPGKRSRGTSPHQSGFDPRGDSDGVRLEFRRGFPQGSRGPYAARSVDGTTVRCKG